jgi:hypothetical protein
MRQSRSQETLWSLRQGESEGEGEETHEVEAGVFVFGTSELNALGWAAAVLAMDDAVAVDVDGEAVSAGERDVGWFWASVIEVAPWHDGLDPEPRVLLVRG